ncbi:MAG: hypothetical protein LCH85_08335 [Chloroflexi bacterium]|nr:hypothetical protein [Chloroflexota bacterium]
MTTETVNRRDRLSRVSHILQLATIIAEEEGLDDNAAYELAEQEYDATVAAELAWSEHQIVTPIQIIPTTWGMVLRRDGQRIVLSLRDVGPVVQALTEWGHRV